MKNSTFLCEMQIFWHLVLWDVDNKLGKYAPWIGQSALILMLSHPPSAGKYIKFLIYISSFEITLYF